jgi:hypothetical protein
LESIGRKTKYYFRKSKINSGNELLENKKGVPKLPLSTPFFKNTKTKLTNSIP